MFGFTQRGTDFTGCNDLIEALVGKRRFCRLFYMLTDKDTKKAIVFILY